LAVVDAHTSHLLGVRPDRGGRPLLSIVDLTRDGGLGCGAPYALSSSAGFRRAIGQPREVGSPRVLGPPRTLGRVEDAVRIDLTLELRPECGARGRRCFLGIVCGVEPIGADPSAERSKVVDVARH
jgi:hypothetical protein